MKAILVTASNIDEAKNIAQKLVEEKLAACVNIIPKIFSIYEWDNSVQNDEESMMIIKTSSQKVEIAKNRILQLHSYTLPEILFIDIKDGHKDYIDWVLKQVK